VAHELRTPITVARGYTELVRSRMHDQSVHDDTGIVLEELDKLARTTQRLVTLMQANVSAGHALVDVDAELIRIGRRWEPVAPRRWSVGSSIGLAQIDSGRLESAVDCLLDNALRFTRDGDRIELIGRRVHDAWSISVRDTGSGMSTDVVAHINAAGGPLQGSSSGTGLGIAIARAVATDAGGRLTVDGAEGRGTTVTLHFPERARGGPGQLSCSRDEEEKRPDPDRAQHPVSFAEVT
jgi:two-component system, OmpR family, sensor kinase